MRPYVLRDPVATVNYSNGCAEVTGPGGTARVEGGAFDILEAMREAMRDYRGTVLAGFLSYELAAELEDLGPLPPADFDFPQMYFGLYERAAAGFDFRRAPVRAGSLTSRPDRREFEASVARIVSRIHAGDIFQTNLCRRIETRLESGSAWDLFCAMRCASPAEYEAYIPVEEGRAVVSISPELFLKAENGVVESRPIKGTRPRGSTPEQDAALAAELLASEKDRAELAMIVDVVRNDLGRVCQTGSVHVAKHAELMTLPTVHHSVSTVRGRLCEDAGPAGLLRAAFPAASITGAPKIEAMRAALREEGQWRGPAMGAIGWIAPDGGMEFSVAIRTAFVSDGVVRYLAGCGITADSDPAAEFAESEHKAAAFVRALGLRQGENAC